MHKELTHISIKCGFFSKFTFNDILQITEQPFEAYHKQIVTFQLNIGMSKMPRVKRS